MGASSARVATRGKAQRGRRPRRHGAFQLQEHSLAPPLHPRSQGFSRQLAPPRRVPSLASETSCPRGSGASYLYAGLRLKEGKADFGSRTPCSLLAPNVCRSTPAPASVTHLHISCRAVMKLHAKHPNRFRKDPYFYSTVTPKGQTPRSRKSCGRFLNYC